MRLSDFLDKYPRPKTSNRTAELAAIIMHKSVKVCPMSAEDAAQYADGCAVPQFGSIAPHYAAYIVTLLVTRAEALHKLAEHDCNYGLTPPQEKRQERLRAEVAEIAEAVGFRAETGGDPRGAVVRLYDPQDERAGDGWGGGYAVYR